MNLANKLLNRIIEDRKRILIIGDRMVDRWIHGHIATCQDGCPKFVQDHVVETPGGAANAEWSIRKWDVPTWLYSYAQNECPIKTRYVEDGKIVFRADNDGSPTRGAIYLHARSMALEAVKTAGGVLLSDYDKGFLTPEFIHDVADLCATRGIPCVADCKRSPEVYAGCILKCNEEYREKHRFADWKCSEIISTNGEHNPLFFTSGKTTFGFETLPPVNCVNHVGAGDCFAAHLTLALAYKFSLREAAALAYSAGRVYVQAIHNRPPYYSEIAADMET